MSEYSLLEFQFSTNFYYIGFVGNYEVRGSVGTWFVNRSGTRFWRFRLGKWETDGFGHKDIGEDRGKTRDLLYLVEVGKEESRRKSYRLLTRVQRTLRETVRFI